MEDELLGSGGTTLKGNVTVRPPLDGSAAYNYTWNVYDRLTQVTRTGQTTVNYDYDTGGRLLRRIKGDEVMVNYWLGLNKIAEERWGSESGKSLAILRPDSEASSSPETNGWISGGSGSMSYATDSARGKVLNLSSDYSDFLIGGDPGVSLGTAFNDSSRKHLGLWIKNADGDPFTITVIGATEDYPSYARLKLISASGTDTTYEKYIGTAWNDGAWHYLEFDLAALVAAGGDVLTRIDGLLFSCEVQDLCVDDIILSGGALEKSYAHSGVIEGGYLGVQTGSIGANGISAWGTNYYHFSDLKTLMATTNASGAKIGVYEPDFFGNYRYVNGNRPDSMGITSKFFDTETFSDYFGFRWYDSGRGRWLSLDPAGFIDGYNLYIMVSDEVVNTYDPTGLDAIDDANRACECQRAYDRMMRWLDRIGKGHHFPALEGCLSKCPTSCALDTRSKPAASMRECFNDCVKAVKNSQALLDYYACMIKAAGRPKAMAKCVKDFNKATTK